MGPIKPNPAKALLRTEIAARIAALTREEKKRQSQAVFDKVSEYYAFKCMQGTLKLLRWEVGYGLGGVRTVINHPYYKTSKRVALFMSTDDEIDTAPLIEHVKARGAAAFVPQYAGGQMSFLRVEEGDEKNMAVTRHGIAQHSKDQKREEALEGGGLDLVIAPGVAFSHSGARLGHGGGYYDRFLAGLRASPDTAPKVVALAFTCQVVDDVPTDEQDQKIDAVISAD